MNKETSFQSGYADINGLRMYYEIYGEGKPLVLIHGGGSTIQTTFGRIIPGLAKNRRIIAADMQAHGRTGDRDTGLSFAQDADDIAALMSFLEVAKADVLGFSNGGQTSIELALRYSERIDKLVIVSAFYKKNGLADIFWEGMANAQFEHMPQAFKDEFLRVNNDPEALMNMFRRDVFRMQHFEGWTEEQIRSISLPTLILSGDTDIEAEHLVEMHRNIAGSRLAILPGVHGEALGEITTLKDGAWTQPYVADMIMAFLDAGRDI